MKKALILIFTGLCLLSISVTAQRSLTTTWESQKASVSTTLGLTEIGITYSAPAVKGRKIWGGLVPFGEVWRAGANDNTVISFPEDVKINGKDIPAGRYGLHIIPTENEWTVIFSKDNNGWGSYAYTPENDALRISVKPYETPFEESLIYTFKNKKSDAADVVLSWEKLSVSFTVWLDVKKSVLKNMKRELTNLAQFNWAPWNQAAAYCLNNNFALEEGLAFVNRSISMNENFDNLKTKAGLLALKGNQKEADELNKKAMKMANETQLNAYGYQLLGQKKMKEALDIFKMNADKNPESWNALDSYAEGLEQSGEKKDALKYYKKALSNAPENQKKRLQDKINELSK